MFIQCLCTCSSHFVITHIYIGQFRGPQLVKNKIEHILQSYKNATDIVQLSGEGLEDDAYESFMEMIHWRHCKWYSALNSVLGSRHNVTAAYTNEFAASDVEQSNNGSPVEGIDCSYGNQQITNGNGAIELLESDENEEEETTDPYSSSSSSNTKKKTNGTKKSGGHLCVETNINGNDNNNDSGVESPQKKLK